MKGGNGGFDSDIVAMVVAQVSDTIRLGNDSDDICYSLYMSSRMAKFLGLGKEFFQLSHKT